MYCKTTTPFQLASNTVEYLVLAYILRGFPIMARVTVEDCLDNVENRFELVMVAAKRAREIAVRGEQPFVEWENDKPTVVALREIADGFIKSDILDRD